MTSDEIAYVYVVLITSLARVVVKYCDEHNCLSVRISLEPHVRSLPVFLSILPMDVARSSSSRVMKSQGKVQFWVFSSPLTMHCNAFAAKVNHSIAINVMQQKGSFRHCRVCCTWDQPGGVMGVWVKCDRRLPCSLLDFVMPSSSSFTMIPYDILLSTIQGFKVSCL